MDVQHERRPWDQQPHETDKAYQAFIIYRDLGIGRKYADAYREYAEREGLKSSKPHASYEKWKRDHSWEERAQCYDRSMMVGVEERRREVLEKIEETVLEELPSIMAAMIRMAKQGEARLIIDLLDRYGPQRKRAGAATINATAENLQLNVDLSGMSPDEIQRFIAETTGG